FDELVQRLYTTEKDLIERSGRLLGDLLNQYTRFSITTIDAFFQKIIRTFARDAGVQGNFKLETDEEAILDEAVSLLITEASSDPVLSSWLVDFAGNKLEAGKSWDISREIKALGKELFTERFKELERFFLQEGFKKEVLLQFLNEISPILLSFENQMKSFGKKGLEIMSRYGLDTGDFKYGNSGVGPYFKKLYEGEIKPLGTRGTNALEGIEHWYTESSPKRDLIIQATEDGLMATLFDCYKYYKENEKQYFTAKEVSRYFYTFGIIANLLDCLTRVKSANDTMLISDSSSFLSSVIEGHDAPFIYEKAGSWYNHFLIDEFQDTSGLQWKNFYPLVENSISQGFKNAIVGDVKQAIYRWRGSDWNLLQKRVAGTIGEHNIEYKVLSENYRSDPAIVHFNNHFFTTASAVLSEAFIDNTEGKEENVTLIQEEASMIREAYRDCHQNMPSSKTGESGYIKVEILGDPSLERSWKEEVLEKLPGMIEGIQDTGIKPADIAILVRKSSEGAMIANRLLAYSKSQEARRDIVYDIISDDILKLRSSNIIACLVSLLRWINDPEDLLSASTFSYFYWEYYSGKRNNEEATEIDAAGTTIVPGNLPESILALVRESRGYHLYELLEEIIRILDLNTYLDELPFLFAFQDMVIHFSAKESGDLSFFLNWWDLTGVHKPIQISGEQNAINILTIHKAKGLQFKVVIIPFCDWPLDHPAGINNFIWGSSDQAPFNKLPFFPLKYGKTLADTYFAPQYLVEKSSIYLDNLNLLYVAFTRAVSGLFIFLPEKSGGGIKSISSMISTVIESMEEFHEETTPFEYGSYFKKKAKDHKDSVIRPEYDKVVSKRWQDRIKVSSNELIKLNEEVDEKIKKGEIIHELLARTDSFSGFEAVIQEMKSEGKIPPTEETYYRDFIQDIFNKPQIKLWLGKAVEIKKELSMIDGKGLVKRPDWVIRTETSLIVIDFKTGIQEKGHEKQVREYEQIAQGMGYKNTESYLVYLFPFLILKVGLP
ncbi:MAG: UvrD-helicase domain-containing protein, partial [Cyclobacteriaceae bacterium]|nr:UvrD-helicase domain-containing protein [Cyclobacteriaceae bacterium]